VKNPFRSEAEAYRFVMGTVVYFGAIAIATAVGGRWWGLGVFVVVTVAVLLWVFRRETRERAPVAPSRNRSVEGERRILVVANETVAVPVFSSVLTPVFQ
jgi:membrane protein implicated in regulation of membrane protease activity